MKCPHCLTAYHEHQKSSELGYDRDGRWEVQFEVCPSCKRIIVILVRYVTKGVTIVPVQSILCYPKAPNRSPLSQEIPDEYAKDYNEASLVLADSPKASAALSRRCLQKLLREKAGVKPMNLADEIQHVLSDGKLPSIMLESLDAIRNIGNFAAHPIKSTQSGEIFDVEPGEAEWNLDVLESLFDYFFVQPTILKNKKDALNAKLKEAGKPEMKKPSTK